MSQAPAVPTAEDLKALVAAKAAHDDAFRADVLANPRAAIEKLFGIELPAHVKLQAIEEPADTHVVVVPRAAAVAADGELSDDDLEAVAGGSKKGAKKFFTTTANVLSNTASGIANIEGAVLKDAGATKLGTTVQSYWSSTCGSWKV